MGKTYQEMTASEKLADRIAKNREIDKRVSETRQAAKAVPEIRGRQKAVSDKLDEFQRIKKAQGVEAASDFVLSRHLK